MLAALVRHRALREAPHLRQLLVADREAMNGARCLSCFATREQVQPTQGQTVANVHPLAC